MGYIYKGILVNFKKEILPLAITWLKRGDMIQSEVSQRQILYGLIYMWNLKQSRLIEAESSRVARGWGRGNGEIQVKRYRAAVTQDEYTVEI